MSRAEVSDQIKHLYPCKEAVEWLDTLSEGATLQDAWNKCHRGDWMLWLWEKTIKSKPWSDDRKPLLACVLDCVETVKHLFGEKTKSAIMVFRQWINGEVAQQLAEKVRKELYTAADYADYAVVAYATTAVSYDAETVFAACASSAVHDAAAIFDVNGKIKNQQQTANIVRKYLPKCPF